MWDAAPGWKFDTFRMRHFCLIRRYFMEELSKIINLESS